MLKNYFKFISNDAEDKFLKDKKKALFLIYLDNYLKHLTNHEMAIISVSFRGTNLYFMIGSKRKKPSKFVNDNGWTLNKERHEFNGYEAFLNDYNDYLYFWHCAYFSKEKLSYDMRSFYMFLICPKLFKSIEKFIDIYKYLL